MLGQLRSGRGWCWSAYGKHPAAKDYFCIGQDSPIAKSFANWTEAGYKKAAIKKSSDQRPVAWRFWSRGAGKESFVCGLVKDSSDSLGRQYPLLIIGCGCLNGWEDRWDLLPLACEKTWEQTEYISAHIFSDIKTMEAEVRNIRPPLPDWQELASKRKLVLEAEAVPESNTKDRAFGNSVISDSTDGIISLNEGGPDDQFTMINRRHIILKNQNKAVPNSIFMGGTSEHSWLAYFNRPLATSDFINLWSLSYSEGETGEQFNGKSSREQYLT